MITSKNRMLAVIFIASTFLVYAQSGGDFEITKSTIASGGGSSNGGNYKINATIGQVDATKKLTGGNFALTGGFWTASIREEMIFENGFE